MCGRVACVLDPQTLKKCCAYQNKRGQTVEPPMKDDNYSMKYNASPGIVLPVLISKAHVDPKADPSERVLIPMTWGLVPSWFKGESSDYKYRTINARIETIKNKATYRGPLKQGKRCALVVNGFFEWKPTKKGKQPYFFYSDVETKKRKKDVKQTEIKTVIAGLFDTRLENNETTYTFTVITVPASSLMAPIHNRMPAILENDEQIERWLNFKEFGECLDTFKPSERLDYYAVSTLVNNTRNESPECIVPLKSDDSSNLTDWLKEVKKEEDDDDIYDKKIKPKRKRVGK